MVDEYYINKSFNDAYSAAIVDGDSARAISLCESIIANVPNHHNARMLIGCLLSDSFKYEKRVEGRRHLLCALNESSLQERLYWTEEDALYQIGIWEKRNGSSMVAAVILALSFCLRGKYESELFNIIEREVDENEWARLKETLEIIRAKLENY